MVEWPAEPKSPFTTRAQQGIAEQQIPAESREGDGAFNESNKPTDISDPSIDTSVEVNDNIEDVRPEKLDNGTFRAIVKDKDGKSHIISAISEEAVDEAVRKLGGSIVTPSNFAQSARATNDPNLTQNGTLNSDKSMRDGRTMDEINEELNLKAGPNPYPNLDGNEITKAENAMASTVGRDNFLAVDAATNRMADRLSEIRRSGTLTDQDKQDLAQMEKELRQTGKA